MKRLTMRKIREAQRLHAGGLSTRKIAASLGVGQSTASDYLKPVEHAGLSWPLAAEMTDAALEALLFHPIGGPSRLVEAQPDWPAIHPRDCGAPALHTALLCGFGTCPPLVQLLVKTRVPKPGGLTGGASDIA